MHRFLILWFVGLLSLFLPALAVADSPHFITATGSLDSTNDYNASFKEAGLGNTPITYDLTAQTETFTFQCFTKSGNTPKGAPNSVSFSSATQQTTITPRNGQITAIIELVPQVDGASCQGGGLKLCLIAADYEGVILTDTTDEVSVNLPDESNSGFEFCGPFTS